MTSIDVPDLSASQGRGIHRHGIARGLRRYKCLACSKTFNALTGTPLARLRKRDRWLKFAGALNALETVRAAAVRAGVGSRFRKWLDRFNGVATKYLPNHLGWRRALEKSGASRVPEYGPAAAIR